MDYVSMVENEVFFLEQAQRQEAMKRYIKECQILATGKNIPYKLNALNEDLKESMTGLWQKIKTIFTRIWLKFLENLDRFVKSDADYLKSYQNIILNKKAPDVNWKMPDYKQVRERCFAGTPEFDQYISDDFIQQMANSAKEASNPDDGTIEEKKAKWQLAIHQRFCTVDKIKTDLKEDDDFNAVVKEYFSGGESEMDVAASELNMTDLYNTCFSAETIINELKKTQVKYNKWIEDVERKYNATYKQFNDMIQKNKANKETLKNSAETMKDASASQADKEAAAQRSHDANVEVNKTNAEMEKAKQDLADQQQKAKEAAAVKKESLNLYSSVYNRILNELASPTVNGSTGGGTSKDYVAPGSSNDTSGKGVSTSTVNTTNKNAAEAARKQQEKNAAASTATAGVKAANDAEASGGLDEKNLQIFATNVTTYSTICTETITTIFGAKCNGITKMRNDYMQIIRYHVKYWLGKPNDSDDNVKTQTATPNPDIKQAVTNNDNKAPGV